MSRAEEFFSSTFYKLSNLYGNWFTEIFLKYIGKTGAAWKTVEISVLNYSAKCF